MVPVIVQVLVAVHKFLVPVGMFMDKVSPEEEIRIGKELLRLPIGHQAMVGPQDNDAGRQFLHSVQVLSAEDQAFTPSGRELPPTSIV